MDTNLQKTCFSSKPEPYHPEACHPERSEGSAEESIRSSTTQDLAFLESAPGRQAIIGLHVRAIIRYLSL